MSSPFIVVTLRRPVVYNGERFPIGASLQVPVAVAQHWIQTKRAVEHINATQDAGGES